jgi:hypothetical protein
MPQQASMPTAPPAQVDLTPVLGLVDSVGKAVNNLGAADAESAKAILQALGEVRNLLMVQVVGLYHLHLANERIAPVLPQQGVKDPATFITYLNQWSPK